MHDMNRSLHLLATGNASALSSGRSHIVIERKDPCRIRGLPYDLGTLRVVLLNHLPVIEKLEIRTLQESVEQLETVHLELSPGAIPAPRIIDDDVPWSRDHPVGPVVVSVAVTVRKDLAITIERGLYGRREVGESCIAR